MSLGIMFFNGWYAIFLCCHRYSDQRPKKLPSFKLMQWPISWQFWNQPRFYHLQLSLWAFFDHFHLKVRAFRVHGPAKHLSTFLHFGPSVNSPCLKQVRKLCSFCNIACYTLKYLSICIYIDNYICICMLAYSSFTHVSHHLVRRPKNYAHWHCILLSRTFSLSDLCFG